MWLKQQQTSHGKYVNGSDGDSTEGIPLAINALHTLSTISSANSARCAMKQIKQEKAPTALTPGDKHTKRASGAGKDRSAKDKPGLALLSLTALGVAYGDIGTSPLYALRECFKPQYGLSITRPEVLGILSLILWSLIVVISVKYLIFVLKADFFGEGGILALVGLVAPKRDMLPNWTGTGVLLALGVVGAALLYGDGMITPAISVMSAVEGLSTINRSVQSYVVPIGAGILLALFLLERRGTSGVGKLFGPVMLVWFATLAVLGIKHILADPGILTAVNPLEAARFFARHLVKSWLALGAVVLVVTGGEALYADIGHFGTRAVRLTWYMLVLPALLLNYFGQGALVLHDKTAASNPFFHELSGWGRYPLVALATAATVIASQAVISGVFSLTQQAVQLGYSPRLTIVHTSREVKGQVYLPGVNYAMMLGCLGLVLAFRGSSNLAAAYGVAVTGTMAITSLLFFKVTRKWRWPLILAVPLTAVFLAIDLAFLSSNFTKIASGGWFPLGVAGLVYFLSLTWKKGSRLLRMRYRRGREPLEKFIRRIKRKQIARSPGTAVFLSGQAHYAPAHLELLEKYLHSLPDRIIILVVSLEGVPRVGHDNRVEAKEIADGFLCVVAKYGYVEQPQAPEILECLDELGLEQLDLNEVTYFVHKEVVTVGSSQGMYRWRKQLYVHMYRNGRSPAEFFGIPSDRIVELGSRTEL